jgi:hypothetical protein
MTKGLALFHYILVLLLSTKVAQGFVHVGVAPWSRQRQHLLRTTTEHGLATSSSSSSSSFTQSTGINGVNEFAANTTTQENDNDNQDDVDDATRIARDFYKTKVQALAFRTQSGFQATPTDQRRMRFLIQQLALLNPTSEPAAAYYATQQTNATTTSSTTTTQPSSSSSSLTGRWTLVYTDAPDILTLADNEAVARVQRIGQECDTSTISNVIEWIAPRWINVLVPPNNSPQLPVRAIQKVVTQATASPDAPTKVNLRLQGLQVQWEFPMSTHNENKDDRNDDTNSNSSKRSSSSTPPPWWPTPQNLRLQGPTTAPFGSFEILYLDNELRIIRTSQGYYAINRRNTPETEWF